MIEILFEPRHYLDSQSYFDRIENKQSIAGGLLVGDLLSSLDMFLGTYEPDRRKRAINEQKEIENKLQYLNKLAGNVGEHGAIENYLINPNNDDNKKVKLMETLFKPQVFLNNKSYFDKIENKQLILEGILTDNNWSGLKKYLADPNINIDNKKQCVNELINRGVMENYLLNPHNDDNKKVELMETLFKPRVFLNNQSYFDRIENKQSILNSLLSGNNHSVLEQYLADHDIDRDDKNQCINRLVNSRAIENYLANPNNDDNKKVELIKTLFEPREELGGQSYFDRIENQQPVKHAILSNNVVLEQYLANERISLQNKQLCLNKLAGNVGEEGNLEIHLSVIFFDERARLVETLFKPRDYLNGQSCFDKIENKQSVARGILSDHHFQRFLEQYLTDNNIEPQNRQQCLNGLSRYPETANWLAQVNQNRSSGLIKILFEPQDELNGQSYFDRIENKQLIRNSFLAGGGQPLLERYLADVHINANDKLQCLNGLNSYPETQDLLGRVRLEPELAVIQTLFAQQNDGLNNQLLLDQYLNDINIPVKNKARTLNSIFTIIARMKEEDEVRINMLNELKNTLTRQSFMTNFEQGTIQMQRLAIGNAGNEEQAENAALPENAENAGNAGNEEHLQDRKTTFLHIMMDPRYDPEYGENLDITSDISRKEVIQKIGQICPELLLDARDQLGNTVLNQTILLPYPNTIQREAGEALRQQEIAAEARLEAAETELVRRRKVQEIEQVMAQDKLEGAQANLQAAQRNLQEAQANLQAAQDDLQLAQENLELKEGENQQACQKLLHYDDNIKFKIMHLLINANTDILYPRIQQMGQGQQVVPLAEQQIIENVNQENHEENGQVPVVGEQPEQQVRGIANQENNGNQQNHINQQNQGENGQVVQRREADSPLIMLLKNNNCVIFSTILHGILLQTANEMPQLFNPIAHDTAMEAFKDVEDKLTTINVSFDNDSEEIGSLNTKIAPALDYSEYGCSALNMPSEIFTNHLKLKRVLNFYLPRLPRMRNLTYLNMGEDGMVISTNWDGDEYNDTRNDYESCLNVMQNVCRCLQDHQNQIQNGPAPAVIEHAEPEVAPQPEPEVQERRPRGGLERAGGANGLRGNQVGGRNGNNRENGIV